MTINRLHKIFWLSLATASSAVFVGCSSEEYGNPDQATLLGDRWNSVDAATTATNMVAQMVDDVWVDNWRQDTKQPLEAKPFIVVSDFENRTSEQIDTQALFEEVRNSLIKSRKVRFVDGEKRKTILGELAFQNNGTTNKNTAKQAGQLQGADFLLIGNVSSIVAQKDGKKNIAYQTEMRLTNIQTGEIVWTNVYKIYKKFKQSGFGF
jgi:penicillin-binding protein activator